MRLVAVLAALVAALVAVPAAYAATYSVTDNGDATDATPNDGICATGTGVCTLRAAIQTANQTAGADTIDFAPGGQAPAVGTALPTVSDPVSIDGGGNTTVTFAPTATGTLLDLQAMGDLVKSITFTGGSGSYVLNLGASGNRLDTVAVRDNGGTAIRVAGSSNRVDGSTISSPGANGIELAGTSATISSPTITGAGARGIDVPGSAASITSPEISGSVSDGIFLTGGGNSVTGGHVHDNGVNGVGISGQQDVVSRVVFYGNHRQAIGVAAGANGGIGGPANLRIGPRRADGSLPLTGTANTGTIELWSGDPNGGSAPGLVDSFRVNGDFSYNFGSEPAPGTTFAVSQTGDGFGTGEFAIVTVPSDTGSPDVSSARALDTSNVRVDFNEPLDPASVQPEDFALNMASVDRKITGITIAPDARSVTLTSSGWRAGEAGAVTVTGPGAITDAAGNAMLTAPRLRVAAAPGDFIAPLGGSLKLTPGTICLTRGKNCRKPGMTITFTSTEAGKARMLIKRGDVTLGSRLYAKIVPGKNTLKFNGRLGARKLRAGRYRLLIYVQDQVGNVTSQPPIQLFSVRRVSK
jgi:CSLREA domain-containing protein